MWLLETLWVVCLVGGVSGSSQCGAFFDNDGDLDIARSLVQCAATMSDAYQPITHVKKYVDMNISLVVSAKFTLNNLIAVDELENTITLDFFWRLFWQDIRWNMTNEFWDKVPTSVYYDGIELYSLTYDTDSPLPYWKPDLHFVDVENYDDFGTLIKLLPDGKFYWSRHVVATIMQPNFDLAEYPKDSQDLTIAFESYGLTQGVMGLQFVESPVGYVTDHQGVVVFSKNPIWFHDENDYSTRVYVNDYTNVPEFTRLFVALELRLHVQRAGRGVLVRFALPILILLLLSAATFWAAIDSRIDTTMTILLSVSALYVVIIEGIPQVGYLTTFDEWIFVMYTTLAIFVVMHQIVVVLHRKSSRMPMRACAIRMIEFIGRTFVAPLSLLYYMMTFMSHSLLYISVFCLGALAFFFFVGTREWGGLKKSFVEASQHIQEKLDEGIHTSNFEMIFMNAVEFKILSTDEKYYKGKKSRRERREIELREKATKMEMASRKSFYDSDDDD